MPPHTTDSEGMIGPSQSQVMKRGSRFVALSRGKTYDRPSRLKALDGKLFAGAGVEVTE